jgi:hypothetical protein
MAHGETSDVQMRGDKTEVKSLVLPETKKDTALLAGMLKCLGSVLEEPKGHEAAHFFVFSGEGRYHVQARALTRSWM